jgi:hypothetical protein
MICHESRSSVAASLKSLIQIDRFSTTFKNQVARIILAVGIPESWGSGHKESDITSSALQLIHRSAVGASPAKSFRAPGDPWAAAQAFSRREGETPGPCGWLELMPVS